MSLLTPVSDQTSYCLYMRTNLCEHNLGYYFLNIILVGDKNDSFGCDRRVSIKHSSGNVFDLRCDQGYESIVHTNGDSPRHISSAYQYISSIWFFLFLSDCLIGIPK